jgi:hypothetical protein
MATFSPIKWSRDPSVRAEQMQQIQEPQQWASQAALNALLKYAPQKEALRQLIGEAHNRFHESVSAGEQEGILAQQAARQAEAPTKQIFANARSAGEAGRNLSAPILAALAPNNPFKAAAANEQAAGTERLGQSETHALSDLQARSVAAGELPGFSRKQAEAKLTSELAKLLAKQGLLEGSEAGDIQAEIGKQRGEANKLAEAERIAERRETAAENRSMRQQRTAERGQAGAERRSERTAATARDVTRRTSRENTEENNRTRRELAHQKGDEIKPPSRKENNEALHTIAEIGALAGHYRATGKNRQQISEELTKELPGVTVKLKSGGTAKLKGHKGYQADNLMWAGLDIAEHGGVMPYRLNVLHEEGYDVRTLPRAHPGPATGLEGSTYAGRQMAGRHGYRPRV